VASVKEITSRNVHRAAGPMVFAAPIVLGWIAPKS
jgi:hypothetical protein